MFLQFFIFKKFIKAIIAAVYIMGIATRMLASLENEKSIVLLSKVRGCKEVLDDLNQPNYI